jgi:hypothetical protein
LASVVVVVGDIFSGVLRVGKKKHLMVKRFPWALCSIQQC